MAASIRPAKRSMGWRVIAEAISGSRQHWKKSRLPLASWYSGRYLPAAGAVRITCVRGLNDVLHTLPHHPHGRAFNLLTCARMMALARSQQLA